MDSEPFFADSAGHTLIDVEAAWMPQTAANDDWAPAGMVEQPTEDSSATE